MYTDTSVRTEGARSSDGPPDVDMAQVQDANAFAKVHGCHPRCRMPSINPHYYNPD
jgi:hypothetical protein